MPETGYIFEFQSLILESIDGPPCCEIWGRWSFSHFFPVSALIFVIIVLFSCCDSLQKLRDSLYAWLSTALNVSCP